MVETRFQGCLLGAAIGDALGMPRAGLTGEERAAATSGRDFVGSERHYSVIVPVGMLGETEIGDPLGSGQWTDDTQLMLALAETLVEEGGLLVPEAWAYKVARWANGEMRLPGDSTLQAALQLRTAGVLWDEAADPDGAGCGPASRVASIGLLYAGDALARRRGAILQAQVTHGHPDAHAAALAVAEAISMALHVEPDALTLWGREHFLPQLAETVRDFDPAYAEFARCLTLAQTLLVDDVEPETALRVLGDSGWAREAVPCALYAVARFPQDYESLMLTLLAHVGGVVESIAAIAGAVVGTLHGIAGIPLAWQEGVEEGPRILTLASQLWNLSEQRPSA